MKRFFIVLLAVALVGAFAVPASAEWNFWGRAKVTVAYESPDDTFAAAEHGQSVSGDDQLAPDIDFLGASAIGARVKAGNIGGRFELRQRVGAGAAADYQTLYGTWNFGAGTLIVGLDYVPSDYFLSGTIYNDNPMLGRGASFNGRTGQIKVKVGGFQLALVNVTQGADTTASGDMDTILPRIDGAYTYRSGAILARIAGTIQRYTLENVARPSVDVTSWTVNVVFTYSPGAWYVKTAAYYMVNGADAGWLGGANATANGTTGIYDVNSWGALITAGFVFNPMFRVEAGYGYWTHDSEDPAITENDPAQFYYIQVPITLAKGVFIIPEVGIADNMKSNAGADQGDRKSVV